MAAKDSSFPTAVNLTSAIFVGLQGGANTQFPIALVSAAYGALASANTWAKAQSTTPVALSGTAGTITPDLSLTNEFTRTMAGNETLANPASIPTGLRFEITIYNPSTHTMSFGSKWIPAGGSAITVSTSGTCKLICSTYTDVGDSNTVKILTAMVEAQ